MILTTPFHPRTQVANRSGLWSHWAGYLSADRYQTSEKAEYFALRTAAGMFDTSPLYKYRVSGPAAERYLSGILARDIRRCPPGHAQYTVWCDDAGHVIEDGVVMRLEAETYLLTSARPNLSYFEGLKGSLQVEISDVSQQYAALAVQGPRSRDVLSRIWPHLDGLSYFGVATVEQGQTPVIVSRTGFTGDLGHELWIPAGHALDLWDAVAAAGTGHGVVPVGQEAVLIARVEAGLLLIDVDFQSSRFARTDTERSTPVELGLGWMLGDLGDDRPFVGREALRAERAEGTARRQLVGLVVDWRDWDARHEEAGLIAPKDHRPTTTDLMVYDLEGGPIGWASSFLYSPVLQRHIALAQLRPDRAGPGTPVSLEVTVDHSSRTVRAEVASLPFYRPNHKTG